MMSVTLSVKTLGVEHPVLTICLAMGIAYKYSRELESWSLSYKQLTRWSCTNNKQGVEVKSTMKNITWQVQVS
jgi:hypothetical protein